MKRHLKQSRITVRLSRQEETLIRRAANRESDRRREAVEPSQFLREAALARAETILQAQAAA